MKDPVSSPLRLRPTVRGLATLAATPLLYASARLWGVDGLLAVAICLALIWAIALALLLLAPRRTRVERTMPRLPLLAGSGVNIPYRISVAAEGTAPLRGVVEVLHAHDRPSEFVLRGIGANRETLVEFESLQRGLYRFGPTQVIRTDPLGLWTRSERPPQLDTLAVWPETVDLPTKLLDNTAARLRHTPRPRFEPGDEFRSLRGYIPGDDVRRIHWRLSAKRNELVVRETQTEDQASTAIVVLDCNAASYVDAAAFEIAVSNAASCVRAMVGVGWEVDFVLVANNPRYANIPSPRYLVWAMDSLADAHLETITDPDAASATAIRALPISTHIATIVCTGGTDEELLSPSLARFAPDVALVSSTTRIATTVSPGGALVIPVPSLNALPAAWSAASARPRRSRSGAA